MIVYFCPADNHVLSRVLWSCIKHHIEITLSKLTESALKHKEKWLNLNIKTSFLFGLSGSCIHTKLVIIDMSLKYIDLITPGNPHISFAYPDFS